jgi:ferrochelatase
MTYLLVNFGGPRSLTEIEPFLTSLLTDQDVIQTGMPAWLHRRIFGRVARRRVSHVAHQYEAIGGKSPLFEDTEELARQLSTRLSAPVLTFHRYLPATHAAFIETMQQVKGDIVVLPLFPQFSYTTTGSAARWMERHLPADCVRRMGWIHSYCDHPLFIDALAEQLGDVADTLLLCSVHGLPIDYVAKGDPYQRECQRSLAALLQRRPKLKGILGYQSQFGKAEWLKPSTAQLCEQLEGNVLIVPLSFVSDHLETLYEIEYEYVARLRQRGATCRRLPALGLNSLWVEGLAQLMRQPPHLCATQMLVRPT